MKSRVPSVLFRHLPKSVLMIASATCLLAGSMFVSHATAEGVALDVKFYDLASGQQITSVKAGSKVKMVASVTVPNEAATAQISVNATAKLKLVGVAVPYKIPMANVTLPNTNPQDGGVLVQTGTQVGEIRVPSATPKGSSIKVTAQATVAGMVSNEVTAKLSVL